MATNAITTQIRIDADAAIKALKNVEAGFDGTESSAQRAAAQIDAMTDVIRANAQQAKTSGDALATALGPDFVSDLERAGGSVDGLVADLRKAGVTFEDMAADADALAASLKRAQDAGNELGTNVSRAASDAEGGLTRVAHAGDNSRSVLANMVGNSVQDLGALGGVAGSAGMAIGQLAEYATEGNISLAGLAGVAGPMIGVASAVAGVVYVMGQLQQAAADVTAEIETLKGVRLDIATGNTADAAAKLAEQYANTVPLLEKYGYSALALTDTLAGNGDVIEALNTKADALQESYMSVQLAASEGDAQAQALSDAYGEQIDELTSLIDTLSNGQTRYAEVSAEQERLTGLTQSLTDALNMSADAMNGTAGNVVVGGYALDEFTQKTIAAKSELIRYVLELNEVPPDVKTDLRAAVKAGDIAAINAILAAWAQGVDVPVRIYTVGDAQGALGGAAAGSKSLAGRFTPAKWRRSSRLAY
jgi:hypothetical protein